MPSKTNLVQFRDANEKAHFVRTMFDRISHRYDLMNRIMTLGQDVRWRRLAIDKAQLPQKGTLLDIACGTGDLAIEAAKRGPSLVVAADFSLNMIRLGKEKAHRYPCIQFVAADGLRMPFPDDAFDAVVTGFSMRNVVDVDQFLREMSRVVRPGGRVVILEITPMKSSLMKKAFQFYFQRIVPLLGGLIAGDREAYTYLPQSVEVFIPAESLKQRMESAGLRNVHYQKLNLGTVALHWGVV